MILTPSSLVVFMSPMAPHLVSKVNGECSTSMAATGACALQRAEPEILESPRCLASPALDGVNALTQLSKGYSLDEVGHLSDGVFDWDHEVGTVELTQ